MGPVTTNFTGLKDFYLTLANLFCRFSMNDVYGGYGGFCFPSQQELKTYINNIIFNYIDTQVESI